MAQITDMEQQASQCAVSSDLKPDNIFSGLEDIIQKAKHEDTWHEQFWNTKATTPPGVSRLAPAPEIVPSCPSLCSTRSTFQSNDQEPLHGHTPFCNPKTPLAIRNKGASEGPSSPSKPVLKNEDNQDSHRLPSPHQQGSVGIECVPTTKQASPSSLGRVLPKPRIQMASPTTLTPNETEGQGIANPRQHHYLESPACVSDTKKLENNQSCSERSSVAKTSQCHEGFSTQNPEYNPTELWMSEERKILNNTSFGEVGIKGTDYDVTEGATKVEFASQLDKMDRELSHDNLVKSNGSNEDRYEFSEHGTGDQSEDSEGASVTTHEDNKTMTEPLLSNSNAAVSTFANARLDRARLLRWVLNHNSTNQTLSPSYGITRSRGDGAPNSTAVGDLYISASSSGTRSTTSAGPSQTSRPKRSLGIGNGNGDDQDDDGGFGEESSKRRAPSDTPQHQRFACPFQKFNPCESTNCGLSSQGFRSVPRVKQHIIQRHDKEQFCERCWKSKHRQKGANCVARLCTRADWINDQQRERLKEKNIGIEQEAAWYNLLYILFPVYQEMKDCGIDLKITPYYDAGEILSADMNALLHQSASGSSAGSSSTSAGTGTQIAASQPETPYTPWREVALNVSNAGGIRNQGPSSSTNYATENGRVWHPQDEQAMSDPTECTAVDLFDTDRDSLLWSQAPNTAWDETSMGPHNVASEFEQEGRGPGGEAGANYPMRHQTSRLINMLANQVQVETYLEEDKARRRRKAFSRLARINEEMSRVAQVSAKGLPSFQLEEKLEQVLHLVEEAGRVFAVVQMNQLT